MKHSNWKRLWSLVLTAAMVLSMLGTVGAAEPKSNGVQYEKIDGSKITANLFPENNDVRDTQSTAVNADEMVRAMVVLEDPEVTFFAMDESQLREDQQEALTEIISEEILGGEELDVLWDLTEITNAMSVNVAYGKLSEIRKLDGVKAVFMETKHEPLKASTNNIVAQNMTGATGVHNDSGVTGAGTRVAVIDTGTDTDHQSFDNGAYLASLRLQAAAKDMEFQAYLNSLNLLNPEKIAAVLPQLNAFERYADLTANDLYLSEKLPFNFNYVDGNLDVTHDNDTQGTHGSHVAGIAVANSLLPCEAQDLDFNGNGTLDYDDPQALMEYVISGTPICHEENADLSGDGNITTYDVYLLMKLLQEGDDAFLATGAAKSVAVTGVAPDAQLITMKVFGRTGGAYASDYIAALEDAVLLGCDVANLSLGGNLAGFIKETSGWGSEESWNEMNYINGVMESLKQSSLVACVSVGNNGNWADYDGAYHHMYTDEGGTFNAADPATFTNALAVASADNIGGVTTMKTVFGGKVEVTANSGDNGVNASWESLDNGASYDVVFLGDPSALFAGETQTDETIYAGEEISEDMTGKVVLIARGCGPTYPGEGISFAEKFDHAAEAGAAAVIVYNNVAGVIYAALDGSTATVPFATITLDEAKAIYALGSDSDMIVTTGLFVNEGEDVQYPTMSDFSSWGPTGALTLKPEITAPGGNIYSINGVDPSGEGYQLMSGTSMASPHVAGLTALANQYMDKSGLLAKAQAAGADVSERVLAQSLMMSTARPMIEEATGLEYSVRNQGAGLANIEAVVNAESFVLMDDQPDGKVKAELGDGTGTYEFGFTVYNLSDETRTYDLSASVLTTNTLEADGHKLIDDAMTELGANVYMPQNLTVPANGSAHATVKLTVTDVAKMAALGYTNGFYVEGFVYLTGADATHSIPMLGWYGSWGDPSMYDNGSYMDYIYGTEVRPGHVPSESGYKNMIGWAPSGSNNVYPYDGNIYGMSMGDIHLGDSHYNPDRNAFNVTENAAYFPAVLFPSMIRNAEAFKVEFKNHETGKIYYEENNYEDYWGMPLYSSAYFPQAEQWLDVTTEQGLDLASWDYTDEETGKLIPEGTLVDFTLTAATEYYVHHDPVKQEVSVDWDALGEGAELTYTFRVDNTAPELYGENPITFANNKLTVRAQDENYIAAMILLDGSGQMAYEFYYPDMDEKGAVCEQELDLTEFRKEYGDKAVVAISDYAGNMVYYAMNLGGEGSSYGKFIGFQYNTKTGYNAWVSFGSDVEANETLLFTNDVDFVCAEYVGGYIFAQTVDGKLYGIPYADMLANTVDLEKTYVATLENVYQDMAYNYSDGKLYGLTVYEDSDGYPTCDILSINIRGEIVDEDYGYVIEEAYNEEWTAGHSGIYALGMAIDDEGSIYLIGQEMPWDPTDEEEVASLSKNGQLWKATQDYDDFWEEYSYSGFRSVGDTGLTLDYLQSMTWDHNTETLYWARFNVTGSKVQSEFYSIDPATAVATKRGDFTKESEVCALMAPLNEDAAAKDEHQNIPEMDNTVVAKPILRAETVTMNLDSFQTLLYDLDPWYSIYKEMVWTSDNEAVATVDQNGTVHALQEGVANIRVASAEDSSLYDECIVNVAAISLELEGIISGQAPGIGATSGVQTYKLTMEKGVPTYTYGNGITDPNGLTNSLALSCSEMVNGRILACESSVNGDLYYIDPETGIVTEALEPVDGDMLFGLSYSEKLGNTAAIWNMYLLPDLPMDGSMKEHVLGSYDETYHEFMWHKLDMLPYLREAGGNFVTGEDNNGASSEIVFCGITHVDNTDGAFYEDTYKDYMGNWAYGGMVNYVADTTIVLLDNVGRLWYIDEITGMTYEEDEWGDGFYVKDDGSMLTPERKGVIAMKDDLNDPDGSKNLYSVFYIREIQETPLTDMFRADKMPRITYHFSDIEFAGKTEEGDPIFLMSLYDYWNDGITNNLYLLVPGHETDEMDMDTYEMLRTPDRLFDLGTTGEHMIIATIHSAKVTGGLAPAETPAAAPLGVKAYRAAK